MFYHLALTAIMCRAHCFLGQIQFSSEERNPQTRLSQQHIEGLVKELTFVQRATAEHLYSTCT